MSEIVIFGNTEMAELVHFFFENDSEHQVKAFTVDGAYVKENSFRGLPIVAFEEVSKSFPADTYQMFIATGYAKLNSLRKQKFLEAKSLGYKMPSYVCSKAFSWGSNPIGENTLILEGVVIQPFVEIGNNVFIWSENHIGHHTKIRDHVFITSHVVIGGGVEIGEQCFLGLNATIRDHIKIGDRCVLGAGAMIMADAEADGLYVCSATERSKIKSSRLRS